MPAERASCATVQGLLRGAVAPERFAPASQHHFRHCASCRRTARDYERLAGELRALRSARAGDDPAMVESIARLVDAEIGRRLRRTWAIATVAGGLVVAAGAGLLTHVAREHGLLGQVSR